jgi:hypothetical protein
VIAKNTFNAKVKGGSVLSTEFVNNPQYKLVLTTDQHMLVKAQCTDSFKQLMIMLIESGQDITETPF